MTKVKTPGRAPGTINKKNDYGRDEKAAGFRCSQGFNKTVEMLLESGQYKSKADIYHEAVQLLAMRKTVTIEHYNSWVKKIQ